MLTTRFMHYNGKIYMVINAPWLRHPLTSIVQGTYEGSGYKTDCMSDLDANAANSYYL